MKRQEREKKFWERFASRYDRFIRRSSHHYTAMLEWMDPYLNKNSVVLELASGTGVVSLAIAPRIKSLQGLDIAPSMVAIAREKADLLLRSKSGYQGNCQFMVGDAYNPELPEKSFDLVLIVNALHIMMEPEKVLSSVRPLLKPEGIILLPTYCHNPVPLVRIISKTAAFFGFRVFHRWSVPEYTEFVENAGFRILSEKTLTGLFPLHCLAVK